MSVSGFPPASLLNQFVQIVSPPTQVTHPPHGIVTLSQQGDVAIAPLGRQCEGADFLPVDLRRGRAVE